MDRLRRLGKLAVVDVTPLRQSPSYRSFFYGMAFTHAARQMTVVAVPLQVFQLTGSTLAVGLLGLAQFIPLLLVSLIGGALADSVDRKRLLILAQLCLGLTAAGLLWNSLVPDPAVWPLFVLSAANAAVFAVDAPTRNASVPRLVGMEQLPSALALNHTLANVAKAAVPAVGGLLIAIWGLPYSYAIETLLFLLSAILLRRLPRIEAEGGGRKVEMSAIVEGLRYLRLQRVIQAAMLVDLNAMVFGMPTALFPAFGTEVLGGDAFTVGLLYAAPGVGSLVAAGTSGWVSTIRRPGVTVLVSVIGWGIAIAVFGLARTVVLAAIMLALAGAADSVSAIFRGAMVQLSVPDALRGRLSSLDSAVTAGGPRLGDLEAGLVAALTSVRFSVVSGGVACLLGAILVDRFYPEFARFNFARAAGDESA
jgi:MFS family permease